MDVSPLFLIVLGSIVLAVIFNYKSYYYGMDYQCYAFLSCCLVTSLCAQDTRVSVVTDQRSETAPSQYYRKLFLQGS